MRHADPPAACHQEAAPPLWKGVPMSAKILLVLSPPVRERLLPLIEMDGFEIEWTAGFQDAVRKLSSGSSYDLLLADAELLDGSWRNLLLFAQNTGLASEMII